jgi:hypothetical protein
MAAEIPNLVKRNGIYYFRCRIPSILTNGRAREVKISLKTGNLTSDLLYVILKVTDYSRRVIAETVKSHNQPLLKERDLKFLKAWRRYNPNWYELIDRLNAAHPVIGQYFCSGAGLLLQRIDAQIMRNVLLNLAEKDIPCLPVHDSAIVQYFRSHELQKAMQQAYEEQFPGFHCGIEAK